MTRSPLHRWVRHAWRDFGWRELGLAWALDFALLAFANDGGFFLIPLHEGVNPLLDPGKDYLQTFLRQFVFEALPLVFAVLVADRAIADDVPPWRAYTVALLSVAVWGLVLRLVPLSAINRSAEHVGRLPWSFIRFTMQGGTGLVVYALWRSSQRATRLAQASETQRARDLQRLQAAQLLALQARVDPQLLFDSLRRIGALQSHDPPSADALLTDLIALLRAMLPRTAFAGSTVGREFAVVDGWLRVTRALSPTPPAVQVDAADMAGAHLAPMLVLPMLRAVLETPGNDEFAWRLGAESAGGRLFVTIAPARGDAQRAASVLERVDLGALRERLGLLHGAAARLWMPQRQPLLSLDVPLIVDAPDSPGARAAEST